jgi:hypothetical protein
MKRFIAISCILLCGSVQALSGAAQIRVEALYDDYRKKYLTPVSVKKQIDILAKTQTALSLYRENQALSLSVIEVIFYLEHLFCHTQSLLTGLECIDNYHTNSLLTKNKDELTLSQVRNLLTQEHSRRRVERGLSILTQSSELHAIAQAYALELCEA